MWVRITENIEIPNVGAWGRGQEDDLPADLVATLVDRGAAVAIHDPNTKTDTCEETETWDTDLRAMPESS